LTVFALTVSVSMRQKLTLGKRLEIRENLSLLAMTGVEKAKAVLSQDVDKDVDTLIEEWAKFPGRLSRLNLVNGAVTYGDSQRAGLEDEGRKINLNKASPKIIKKLIQNLEDVTESDAEELAFCIVDWRDSDSAYAHPEYGAEDKDYEDLKLPYESKDAPFEILDELLLVKGLNRDIFNQIRPWVTVYGTGAVNVNTAPQEVLIALGLSEPLVEKILRHRQGKDRLDGSGDDIPFLTAASIAADMALDEPPITETETIAIENLLSEEMLGVSSTHFTVRTTASLTHSAATMETESVISRDGKTLFSRSENINFHKTLDTNGTELRVLKSE
jgi:type II secretory pathway component PulK